MLFFSLAIKAVFYSLNLLGEKEKYIKDYLELIKGLPPIETVGNDGKTKLLFEEVFSLTYKESLSLNEIKALLRESSPRQAISKFLAASPYLLVTQQGNFQYSKYNKIRIDKFLIPFSTYRISLIIAYIGLAALGIWLLSTYTPQTLTLPPITQKDAISTYIEITGAMLFGLTSIGLAIKILAKLFKLPLKGELLKGIRNIENNEFIVISHGKTRQLYRRIKISLKKWKNTRRPSH